MSDSPLQNVSNGEGRTPDGKFAKGWKGGPGNPYAAKTAALRATLMAAVTEQDLNDVVRALVNQAKDGDVPAARELLDRLFGKATQSVEVSGAEGTPLFKAFINIDADRI